MSTGDDIMEINTSIMFKWDKNAAQWIPVRQKGWLQKLADIFEEETELRHGNSISDRKLDLNKKKQSTRRLQDISWIFLRTNT